MRSLLQPRRLFGLLLTACLVSALYIPANDNETLPSAELDQHLGALTLEPRAKDPTPLHQLLIDAEGENTRLDTESWNKERKEGSHAPITKIEGALGYRNWTLAVWSQNADVVLIVVLQRRAILVHIPWDRVNDAFKDPKVYDKLIGNPLFGNDGTITLFRECPLEGILYEQRRFKDEDWTSDAIQVFIKTRISSDKNPLASFVLNKIVADLRIALTAEGQLDNILSDMKDILSDRPETSPRQWKPFLVSLKRWRSQSIAQEMTTKNIALGTVLSWRVTKSQSVLELWDGGFSQQLPIRIPLYTQRSGLYPKGVVPKEGGGCAFKEPNQQGSVVPT